MISSYLKISFSRNVVMLIGSFRTEFEYENLRACALEQETRCRKDDFCQKSRPLVNDFAGKCARARKISYSYSDLKVYTDSYHRNKVNKD